MKRRVVVTGIGTINPLGLDTASTWSSLLEGRSGAAPITQFDASVLDVGFACEVKGFDPLAHFDKKELRRMDRFIQLGLVATAEAWKDSGLQVDHIDKERVGTILSSGMGGLKTIEDQTRIVMDRPDRVSPFFIPSAIVNLLPGQVSIRYGLQGPNLSIVTACSSSAHAIGEAQRIIERGDADVMVAGGAESTICVLAVSGFANMKALSKRNHEPEKGSRPFDRDRDGFVMGEGAGTLILESLEHAQKRGAKIYAEVVGYGRNSDAFHETNPSPGGEGAARCMRMALKDAGIDLGSGKNPVGYINMHGTSTPAGDVAESEAIESVFGSEAAKLHCNSTKSMTGHLLGAAGAVEAIFTILALRDQICPPTINIDNQDERCRLNYTSGRAVKKPLQVGLSNSFGFGGTNASLLLARWS